MIPATYNLPDAYMGDTYGPLPFTFTDSLGSGILLDGMSAACQVRHKKSKVMMIEWLSSNSGISISGSQLILNPISGSAMRIPANTYEYDIELNNSGIIHTYLRGDISVYQDVTNL